MQIPEGSPLPDVVKALAPWIKPRDEVANIRAALQEQLASSTTQQSVTLNPANLLNATPKDDRPIPSSVTGVRKAYLSVLQSHSAAQARYGALKADLEKLLQPHPAHLEKSDGGRDPIVPVLRQREKARRLQAIEHSLTEIEIRGSHIVGASLDDVVKQRVGELPVSPSAQSSLSGGKPDVENLMWKLKREVLATRRALDACSDASRRHDVDGHAHASAFAAVAGLQASLNELTGWMEQQLAIIGDAETQSRESSPPPKTNGHSTIEVASPDEIERLYDEYLTARERLLQTLSTPPSLRLEMEYVTSTVEQNSDSRLLKRTTSAQILMPYLGALTALKREEQSLLQQSVHIRQHLAQSEEDSQRLITRLAEESHLVQPGAARAQDWAAAAATAGQTTAEYIEPKIQVGEEYVNAASVALAAIQDIPVSLQGLHLRS